MGLVNSLGSGVPGGQSNAPSLNPPNQIDPSSIERAYAALGLTYQGNQMPQQSPQANMPNQGMPGQPGMRSLNAMGQCVRHAHLRLGGERPELSRLRTFVKIGN